MKLFKNQMESSNLFRLRKDNKETERRTKENNAEKIVP